MFVIDADLAKKQFAERLRQAEHERLIQELQANKPKLHSRLLGFAGNLLIALGTSLKARLQEKYV